MKAAILPMIFLLVVGIVFAGPAGILVSKSSSVTAQLLYYEPVPAQPGDQVDVWIQLDNDGGGPTSSATVTILDSGSISPETESDRTSEIPSIPPQQSFLLQLKLRIAKNANEGTHTIVLQFKPNDKEGITEVELDLTIQEQEGSITVLETKTTPEEIIPGGSGTIDVLVKNVGASSLRNIDLTLDFNGLSIAPAGNSNSRTIRSLSGGKEFTFQFDIATFPEAVATAVQIPLTVTYNDEQGNKQTQEEIIGIVIGATPELLVYFEDVQITNQELEGEVILKFVNKGLSEIKLLEVQVMETNGIQVTSESPVIYVGNIDEDDYESADMTLKIVEGTSQVPIKVTYKDALNRQYEEELIIPLRLQDEENGNGNTPWMYAAGLAVLFGLYWFWRKRRKK